MRPATRTASQSRRHGFTLVEMMIVVAVMAVLAALAVPSYQRQVAKSRRADAQQALMALAQRMERFYTERGTYAGAALGPGGVYPTASPAGHYTLAIASQDADGFVLSATPTGAMRADPCGSLTYNALGEGGVSGGSLPVKQCW